MSFSRKGWVAKKIGVAKLLYQGECGGGYGEAVIIICSAMSAMAADAWPGDHIDRKRFVEIVSEYGNLSHRFLRISIPLLFSSYIDASSESCIAGLKPHCSRFPPGRIMTGEDSDMTEYQVAQLCPALSLKEIRKYSYPNILYQQVRSGYVHQYQPGPLANSWQMTSDQEASVSYSNTVGIHRQVYFHLHSLCDVAGSIAESLDKIENSLPLSAPRKWWVEG